ncbi:unnamed protein product [Sphagnum balticum]
MEEQKDSSLTNYQFKGIYGTTDLWSEDPWGTDFGNWPAFNAHFGFTEADYNLDKDRYAKRVRNRNETYISELKADGRYGTEYIVDVAVKHNPIFYAPKNQYPNSRPLESYRMAILDEFVPKYKAIGWVMEYEFEPEGRGHVFYCHPIGVNRNHHNIRTVSAFTDRTVKAFAVEFTEVVLQVVLGNECYIYYEPDGNIKALFFNEADRTAYEQSQQE